MQETNHVLLRIGLNIRMRRHIMKLTQLQLAQRMECSVRRISQIEHGRVDVPIETMLSFTRALECGLQDLLLGV